MTELQEYVTTGMLGSYQPERAVLQQAETGVFPSNPTATPTDKMLGLIDAELKKEAHGE